MALVPGEIVKLFQERYQSSVTPQLYLAPGRVNLIGEHTDYNLGFVFPIALEMACYVAIAPASHGRLDVFSRDMQSEFSIPAAEIGSAQPLGIWSDYVLGVARELAQAGVALEGADLFIASDVPAGSGLSSSASLEIASAFALLGSRQMEPLEIALLGQRAESKFVG
ncbi:MAG TPA: galactokinase family protein, partial [Bryobacteraceae bacterium]|nr:galactokinase family protein [Bryobacteraceae bacterium]